MIADRLDVGRHKSALWELQRDAAWRRQRVSVAAYFYAERRNFAPGGEGTDWLLAEAEIDRVDAAGE